MPSSERLTTLPTRNGVGPSSVALPPGPWTTLIDFLAERFSGISRDEWLARMARGDVLTAQGDPATLNTPYQAHTKVHYYRHLATEPRIPFDEVVLAQDEHLIVVDKPHFLPVMPAGRYVQETLLVRLKRRLGIDALVPIHRIDRDTAGLVLFAVQPASRDRYAVLFRQRAVSKRYEAIAPWRADLQLPLVHRSRLIAGDSFMQMREIDGTPNAETAIALLETRGNLARYSLSPVTGKKHQLRAHMAALGIPIVNDRIYPQLIPRTTESEPDYSHPLQLLAKSLTFLDPLSGRQRHFESGMSLRG
jgi:tRNA pseudouridine32 synthase/23S rRNA pseudouridine746 synthase